MTEAGKTSSSKNALIFGDYAREAKASHKRIVDLIRACKEFARRLK